MAKRDFNEFRFSGLNYRDKSNKYLTMDRVSADEDKIVVKVGSEHVLKTKYGYALILDRNHVVFLKDWQVSENYFGTEVLLTKQYFNVKEWGDFEEFDEEEQNLDWSYWLFIAREQDSLVDDDGIKTNRVNWEKQ